MDFEEIASVLEEARAHGVRLWVSDRRLHFRAAAGVMPEALLESLQLRKDNIVSALSKPMFVTHGAMTRVPLLHSSRRFWNRVRAQAVDVAVANRTHLIAKWTGELDRNAIKGSIASLVSRHSILRARINERNGVPEFVFDECETCVPEFHDLAYDSPDRPQSRVAAEVARLVWRPFDLGGPFFRAFILRLSDREHIVGMVAHHFIADLWSIRICAHELAQGYEHHRGRCPAPPMPSIQYSDYVVAMNAWLESEGAAYRLAYWRRIMAGAPCTRIPVDHELDSECVGELDTVQFDVDGQVTAGVRNLGHRLGTTLFIVVLAAMATAIAALSGASDLSFRVVISGRENPRLAGMIGNIIDFMPVRISMPMQSSFAALVVQVHRACGAAGDHHLPSEYLETALRDAAASDIFPRINFISARATEPRTQMNASQELLRVPFHVTPRPITRNRLASHEMNIVDDGESLRGGLTYMSARYHKGTVLRFVSLFRLALERAAMSPDEELTAHCLHSATKPNIAQGLPVFGFLKNPIE